MLLTFGRSFSADTFISDKEKQSFIWQIEATYLAQFCFHGYTYFDGRESNTRTTVNLNEFLDFAVLKTDQIWSDILSRMQAV